MKEILYSSATTETGYGRVFIIDKTVTDEDKKDFNELIKEQKLKKGKVKKIWEKPRFERKCK